MGCEHPEPEWLAVLETGLVPGRISRFSFSAFLFLAIGSCGLGVGLWGHGRLSAYDTLIELYNM